MASRSKIHPSYKTRYRVTNWPEYDKGLVDRIDPDWWFVVAHSVSFGYFLDHGF